MSETTWLEKLFASFVCSPTFWNSLMIMGNIELNWCSNEWCPKLLCEFKFHNLTGRILEAEHRKSSDGLVTMSDSCNPKDYSLPGSSVHRILQARILEWIAISFFRGSSWPRDGTPVSCIAGSLLHCRQILYWLNHQESPWKEVS